MIINDKHKKILLELQLLNFLGNLKIIDKLQMLNAWIHPHFNIPNKGPHTLTTWSMLICLLAPILSPSSLADMRCYVGRVIIFVDQ